MNRFVITYQETRTFTTTVSFDDEDVCDGAVSEDAMRRALGGIGLIHEGPLIEDRVQMVRTPVEVKAVRP